MPLVLGNVSDKLFPPSSFSPSATAAFGQHLPPEWMLCHTDLYRYIQELKTAGAQSKKGLRRFQMPILRETFSEMCAVIHFNTGIFVG